MSTNVKRVTLVRAELLADRQYIVAWASCPADGFTPEARERLEYALSTFSPRNVESDAAARQALGSKK